MSTNPLLLEFFLASVSDGVYHTDLDRRILYWNAGAQRITGHTPGEVTGSLCQDRIVRHVDSRGQELCDTADCPLCVARKTAETHEADLYLHHREGHLVPVTVRTIPYFDNSGNLAGLTQVFRERSPAPSRERRADWKKAALTDPLTGLGNRRAFRRSWNRVQQKYAAQGMDVGVLMVDVDHFKQVNDQYGHGVGDKVLRMVARTLAGCLRKGDTAVRWGGEEFLILVPRASASVVADLAERIRHLAERSWVALADGTQARVTVSVGGAQVRAGDTIESVADRADSRLYECKNAGRNRSLTGD